MLVFPGMIDSHVHIRGGRLSHREDFASGTMAAAAGGVTALAEMPVANPPASTAEVFEARRAEAQGRAPMWTLPCTAAPGQTTWTR